MTILRDNLCDNVKEIILNKYNIIFRSEGTYKDDDSKSKNELDNSEPGLSNQSLDMESSPQHSDNGVLEAPVTTSSRSSTTRNVSERRKDITEKILNIIEWRASQPPSAENDDVKFLLSFRGDMKRMSPNQKLDFKIEMLQLVKRINHRASPFSHNST